MRRQFVSGFPRALLSLSQEKSYGVEIEGTRKCEKREIEKHDKVPPRFELGSLDSKSRVLTITPWDQVHTNGNEPKEY